MYAIVFYVVGWFANILLVWSALVIRASMSSAVSKDEARKGLLLGIVLMLLNVGLLLALDDRSFVGRPWRYAGILAGGVLIYRFLTIRVQELVPAAETQPTGESASLLSGILAAVCGLSTRSKAFLLVVVAAAVLVVGGLKILHTVQAAWNYKLEGDYAQREAEGIAQIEREADSVMDAPLSTDDPPQAPADAPIPQGGVGTLEELLALAPSEGNGVTMDVVFYSDNSARDRCLWFAEDAGDYPPEFSVGIDSVSFYTINGEDASPESFFSAVCESRDGLGMIQFNMDELVSADLSMAD